VCAAGGAGVLGIIFRLAAMLTKKKQLTVTGLKNSL